jgi:signal transduction histidine kinase
MKISWFFLLVLALVFVAALPFLLVFYLLIGDLQQFGGEQLLQWIEAWPWLFFGGQMLYSLIIAFVISRILGRPLRQLEASARKMAQGEWGSAIGSERVFGFKVRELDSLAQSVEQVRKKIVQSNQELESQVAERTWDLHVKINQLTNAEKKISAVNQLLAESSAQNERQKVLLQDVIDNIPVGAIISRGPNRDPEFINHRAHQLLAVQQGGANYSERYQLFQLDKKTVYPAELLPLNASFKSGKSEYKEDIFVRQPNGNFIQLYAQSSVLYDKVGAVELSIMVFDDITVRKEIERQKSEFVSVASHQLRTPLSAIKWFAELLLDPMKGKLNPEQKEYVDNIFHSTERVITLVNSLLNVSRIESKRVAITPQPTDMVQLIQSLVTEQTPLAEKRHQKIVIQHQQEVPQISLDPAFISEAIGNILSNAVKYSPDGSQITVTTSLDRAYLKITVQDQGLGIPVSSQAKVFTKFFRADNVVRKETEGTGLGLYVAKEIIEASGGTISFTSEEDKGTTFDIRLPLAGSPKVSGDKHLI